MDKKIQDIQSYLDDYYVTIIDPFDPKKKLIYADNEQAIVTLGDNLFLVEFMGGMNLTHHLSEVLYLLSCIQMDPESPFDKYYGYWIELYDKFFENINQGLFSNAVKNLDEMASYQPYGKSSKDEQYMRAVHGVLTNAPNITKTGYSYYDSITEAYSDMFSSQGRNTILKQKDKREELLTALRGCEKTEVVAKLINLFLQEGNCDDEEYDIYLNEIIARGEDIDVKIIKKMGSEPFLSYLLNSLHTSFKQSTEQKYETSQLREFFHEEPAYNNPNILIVKDCTKAQKDDYKDVKEIMNKLSERGLQINEDSAYFIYLFRENRGTFRTWDYDALVFSKDTLYHVPNYTGSLTGQTISRDHFRELCLGDTDKLSLQERSKFCIENKAAVQMVKNMSKAHHLSQDMNIYKNELKKEMANSFISIVNDHQLFNTVPNKRQPITYGVK